MKWNMSFVSQNVSQNDWNMSVKNKILQNMLQIYLNVKLS